MDRTAMQRCLDLARRGQGLVGNGALVGAVLVRDGRIIAEGFHEGFGLPHAERLLLQKFDQKILQEDVLFVNLEPCCHHGKTPPCADLIIEKGIKNVVIGMLDPDSRVSGKGLEELRKAGVNVRGPVLRAECEALNRGFGSVRTRGRPWITVKRAQTVDGRIASKDGLPMQITSEEQDLWSHEFLRARHDAILVGIGTVLRDDPKLTVRHSSNTQYQPWRIILDPHGRTPASAKLVTDDRRERTIIITSPITKVDQNNDLYEGLNGIRVVEVPVKDGLFVFEEFWKVLTTASGIFCGITSILVEGGQKTWKIFRTGKVVDEEVTLMGELAK